MTRGSDIIHGTSTHIQLHVMILCNFRLSQSKKRPTPGAGGGGGGVEKKQKADCAEHVPKWKSMVADDQVSFS